MYKEVIWQGDSDRLVKELDGLPTMPEDHGAPYTVLISNYYSRQADFTEFNSEYAGYASAMSGEAVLHAFGEFKYRFPSFMGAWEAVKRYYRIFHDTEIAVSRHTGYSQGDEWALISFDTPQWRKATGAPDSKDIEQAEWIEPVNWARGDVWVLVHERLQSDCGHEDCDREEHFSWVEEDSCGGYYTDDDAELVGDGRWQFGLEEVERA